MCPSPYSLPQAGNSIVQNSFEVKYLPLSNFMFHLIFLKVFYDYVPHDGHVGRNMLH